MRIKDFETGTVNRITVLLTDLEERTSKNGNPYTILTVSDGTELTQINLWQPKSIFPYEKGEVLDCDIEVRTYQGKNSYVLQNYGRSHEGRVEDFVISAPIPAEKMYADILKFAENIGEYGNLVRTIFQEHREKLLMWGAGKTVHHDICGGLLYHVYVMLRSAMQIYPVYQDVLDKELLAAGIILHDIGKLRELDCGPVGDISYSVDGELFGHLYIGAEMIHEYAARCGLSPEKERLLKHVIISHHGTVEMGAVKIPAIPEAALINAIDNIDAKIYQFRKVRDGMQPGTLSEKVFGLGCKVYSPE